MAFPSLDFFVFDYFLFECTVLRKPYFKTATTHRSYLYLYIKNMKKNEMISDYILSNDENNDKEKMDIL